MLKRNIIGIILVLLTIFVGIAWAATTAVWDAPIEDLTGIGL